MDDAFVSGIVVDLRKYCADLLHQGVVQNAATSSLAVAASPTDLGDLAFARLATREVRRFLGDQWDVDEVAGLHDRTPVPVRARAPRDQTGWSMVEGRAIPRYWLRPPLRQTVDPRHVEWLIRLIQEAIDRARRATFRLSDAVRDAKDNIASTSEYAAADIAALERIERGAVATAEAATRLGRELASHRNAARSFRAGRSAPFNDPAAARLRDLARIATRDEMSFAAGLARVLTPPIPVADLPFLYQRWVGLQLIRAIERAGFSCIGNPRGALFLGGHVRFERENAWVELWLESRLSRSQSHPSGLSTDLAEISPDFVIAVPGDMGRDFYVLDATLGTSPERLRDKCDYRKRCHTDVMGAVAGWTVRRRPLRAWAVAPLRQRIQLMSEDGSAGALGLRPDNPDFAHLDSWCADAVRHAGAWAGYAVARPREPAGGG